MADITRGVRAFTFGTAVSRVLGLVRESVRAFLYGAGRATDAYLAAFRILDLLRDLFAESTLSAAIVPILTAQKQKSIADQNRLASNIFNILLIVVGVITLAGIFLSPYITRIIAFGFVNIPGKLELTSQLTAVMFPFLLFIALAAWAMSYLNTENEFLVPSLAPAAFNLFSILTTIILYAYLARRGIDPIFALATGALVGGLLQFFIQVPTLFRKGFRYYFYINFRDPEFLKVLAIFVPVAIGLAGSRINVAVDVVMVSFLEERSMTWLDYAFRVMHLPLGLFGIAVGTVALPALSQFVLEKKFPELREATFDALKLVLFLTISTSVIIAFLSYPIIKIIYERGKFTGFDTGATAQALILYMIGVPFMSGIRNIAAVFYAFKDSKTPMYASFASIVVHIALNLVLMWYIGFRSFPLTTSAAAFANLAILFYYLPRKIGQFDIKPILKYSGLLTISSGIAGVCGLIFIKLAFLTIKTTLITQIIAILLAGTVSLLVFYVVCRLIGVNEVKDYVKRLMKR